MAGKFEGLPAGAAQRAGGLPAGAAQRAGGFEGRLGGANELPPELRAFLYSCIDSVEQVEILVLLCRESGPWTARATAERLGFSDGLARRHLETLSACGLLRISVAAEVLYGYAPKNVELRRYADQLSEHYATARTAIMRFVASNPRRLKRFADAFKLRDPE